MSDHPVTNWDVILPEKNDIILSGESVSLRLLRHEDANEVYLSWLNDSEVTKGLDTITKPYTIEMLTEYVNAAVADKFGYMFVIILHETNTPIGTARVHNINMKSATCNLGMMIGDKKQWGKGLGKKVYKLLIGFAFNHLNIRRIWEAAHADNLVSLAMCEGLGFKREGILREHILTNRGPVDKILLGLLKKEWIP
jgi:ribosomal-protein-alanine N-acetyltransferase